MSAPSDDHARGGVNPARRSRTPSRHGRRPIRSSMTGPALPNTGSRVARFERDARAVVEYLQREFPEELHDVQIGFQTVPTEPSVNPLEPNTGANSLSRAGRGAGTSTRPMLYSVNRDTKSIILYRMPIQRARGLHVDDEDHRRYFVEHCVYMAVCEYLGREPWELLPGQFDHF